MLVCTPYRNFLQNTVMLIEHPLYALYIPCEIAAVYIPYGMPHNTLQNILQAKNIYKRKDRQEPRI